MTFLLLVCWWVVGYIVWVCLFKMYKQPFTVGHAIAGIGAAWFFPGILLVLLICWCEDGELAQMVIWK